MKVSLRLFAGLRELVGERQISLELADSATIADLRQRLAADYPAVGPLLPNVAFAVDDEYVTLDERLRDGVEVALIPPVSGGSGDLYRITTEPLVADELVALVQRDEAGAIDLFYGVVRDNTDGRAVLRLEYEAHEAMALAKMREVGEAVKARFPICEIGVWHRVGTLQIGESSLLVAVSSAHRKEAFEACHWAVDRIKEVVPVWKKEFWADGSAWVEGHTVEPPELAGP
jgi:molybdopterin synthase catalytic subunit